jgi:hypothetical protein
VKLMNMGEVMLVVIVFGDGLRVVVDTRVRLRGGACWLRDIDPV